MTLGSRGKMLVFSCSRGVMAPQSLERIIRGSSVAVCSSFRGFSVCFVSFFLWSGERVVVPRLEYNGTHQILRRGGNTVVNAVGTDWRFCCGGGVSRFAD